MPNLSPRKAAICIFAKPPRSGEVKTRLIPLLGAAGAAALAEAFLHDTVSMVRQLEWAECVLAVTEPFARDYFSEDELWLQGDGGLEMRLERVFQRGLQSYSMVFALGADSPGLPASHLEQARRTLEKADAVIGPAADGGFCFLGLKKCPPGLFHGIPWSSSETMAQTIRALQRHGIQAVVGEPWFDVDTPEDLARVSKLTEEQAPATMRALRGLG
jgi:rSAM/selenodomain-associated transferase 1